MELLEAASGLGRLGLYALHGSLSQQDQDAALRPDPQGRRKVILSSPIAESSLTIPGVRIVIDSGALGFAGVF